MKSNFYSAFLASLLLSILLVASSTFALDASRRDYLTPKEEDQVREAQIIDKRIEVFIKAAERRLQALTNSSVAPGKQAQKDLEKWGELPTGTRAELIMDIANILDAAITNIDDVATRDEKNALIPKALRKLAEAVTRFQPQIASMREQAKTELERNAVDQVIGNIQEILGAAGKLQPEEKKKKA
jgi:acyl-CoA reductase-like NAD-dependent aldehyde dehydrogenase